MPIKSVIFSAFCAAPPQRPVINAAAPRRKTRLLWVEDHNSFWKKSQDTKKLPMFHLISCIQMTCCCLAGKPAETNLPSGGAAPQWDAAEGWVGAEVQVWNASFIQHTKNAADYINKQHILGLRDKLKPDFCTQLCTLFHFHVTSTVCGVCEYLNVCLYLCSS